MSEMISEPAAPAAEAPTAESEAEEWGGVTQEDWQNTQQALQYLVSQASQQAEPEPQQQPQQPTTRFDPFADDPDASIRQVIREETAQLAYWQEQQRRSEAEELSYDILDDISNRQGELELGDAKKEDVYPIIRSWADNLMYETAPKYGWGPRAAEAALEQAYTAMQSILQANGQAAVNRHMNQLHNLGNARAEPPAFKGSAQAVEIETGGDELDLVRQFGGYIPGQ